MKGDIMLYRIDEYIAEYDYRPTLELLRFKDCDKYLHKMTLDEVNDIVSSWKPVIASTALYTSRKINQYFDWLRKQNEDVSFDARDIKFPIRDDASVNIFSTDDIQKYYNILYEAEVACFSVFRNVPWPAVKSRRFYILR